MLSEWLCLILCTIAEDARSKGFPLTGEGLLESVKVGITHLCASETEGEDPVVCAEDKAGEAVDLKWVARWYLLKLDVVTIIEYHHSIYYDKYYLKLSQQPILYLPVWTQYLL